MNETVKALSVEEAAQQISDDIAAFLEGGPNRKAESIELAKAVGLKLEGVRPGGTMLRSTCFLHPQRLGRKRRKLRRQRQRR